MSGSSTSSKLSIILDDKRVDAITLGPNPWSANTADQWLNGTVQAPAFALNGRGLMGTLQAKFQGTSIAFFGVTPPANLSQNLTIAIDDNAPYNSSYSDPNPQTYRQWYQSPQLSDGAHTVTLSNLAGTSFDFAVVNVGPDTPLVGQPVIADNDDSGFTFNGTWQRNLAGFNSGPNADGFAFHNSTHDTWSVGSGFTYRFTGKSAAVYGIFTWANLGLLSLTFTLDGAPLSKDFRVSSDTPQFVSEIGQQQNFLFHSYDFLESTDHTLVVNITQCINQTFSFDYITYTPTFTTLADMPNLSQDGGDSNNNTGGQSSTSKTSTAAIVGGAVAGIIILLMMIGLAFLFRRRRKTKRSSIAKYQPRKPPYPSSSITSHTPTIPVDPFVHRRAEVTAIPLAQQTSPPGTSSSYHDDGIERRQSMSAAQYGVYMPARDHPDAMGSPALPSTHTGGMYTNTGSTPPTTATTGWDGRSGETVDATGRQTDPESTFSQWDGSRAEPSPPSYEETTRGQPPTQISYIIRR
ncbi:unnamed protein product [Cyclocybe aegerita]|uniref:Uncharacterized protein n=1 Tax=Cyclocybe aegerita TaxID=1973307 RepID=A0A8S0W9A3_CYCAE|nr:unnamed protein product [Cyclocybe aegerita]